MTTRLILFRNATIVDGARPDRREGHHVLVEGGTIREVSDRPIAAASADVLDLRGRTLMPGLIDCHVHVIASLVNLSVVLSESLMTLRALPILRGMLERGFTTVRDAGGADYGLAQAIEQGLAVGPRLFVPGKALSQTGGTGTLEAGSMTLRCTRAAAQEGSTGSPTAWRRCAWRPERSCAPGRTR